MLGRHAVTHHLAHLDRDFVYVYVAVLISESSEQVLRPSGKHALDILDILLPVLSRTPHLLKVIRAADRRELDCCAAPRLLLDDLLPDKAGDNRLDGVEYRRAVQRQGEISCG